MPEPTARRWLPLAAAAAVAVTAAELALPGMLGRAVDAVVGHDGTARGPGAGTWLAWCTVAVVVLVIAEPARDLAAGYAAAGCTATLRRRLIRHLLAAGPSRTAPPPASGASGTDGGTGDLVNRVVGGASDAGQLGVARVFAVISVAPAVGALVALAWIDVWLIAGFLAGAALVTLMLRGYVREASDAAVAYQRAQSEIAGRLSDALRGSRTIAAAGTAGREVERCLRPLAELSAAGRRTWRVLARSSAQGALVGPLLPLVVLAVGGWELSRGRLTPGELIAAVQYAALGAGLGSVVAALNRVARARAGVLRTDEVLRRPAAGYGSDPLPPGPGTLEFVDVAVHDAGTPVMSGLDLVVPGGATVAVVGPSGSGKSLLAALAARLVDPDAGEVRLDGVPLRRLSADALRREVGVAFERPTLLGGTVADAVGLAHDPPDRALAAESVRLACAGTYVSRLPAGLDTPLERAPMSGGEAQRLGLARAWHAGRLLVLDDATSSLDTATEAQITRLLLGDPGNVPGGDLGTPAGGDGNPPAGGLGAPAGTGRRTQLIVAHRASTAARCRFVVWLDGGRIRAVAPHATLWAVPGYRAIFQGAEHDGERHDGERRDGEVALR